MKTTFAFLLLPLLARPVNASHSITFAPGGDTLLLTDNIFQGKVRTIAPATGCTDVTVHQNVGTILMNETNSP